MPGDKINNASPNAAQNAAIKNAIDQFDIAQARALLREALSNADGETFYLASLVALNDRQKREFLQKAVAADPFHVDAFAALDQLTNPRPVQIPTPLAPPPSRLPVGFSIPGEALAEPTFLQNTLSSPPTIPASPYVPPVLSSTTVPVVTPGVQSSPSATFPTVLTAVEANKGPESGSIDSVSSGGYQSETMNPTDKLRSDNLNEMLTTPTPPGGIAIQSLFQSNVGMTVPQNDRSNDLHDKDYVKGIVQHDTPLFVIPDRRGSIRAQLLAFAEVILLARTDDSRWVNVIWLSSINKETLGWLPLSTLSNGYVQGNTINMIDLPITQYEYNDIAHLVAMQSILQQEKWDRLRRSLNLVAILSGIAFCSFFLIDAAVGTRVPLDYLSISLGIALVVGGFGRWWIGVGIVRRDWRALDLIRRRKQATEEATISQQANTAALKLASEMLISLLRNRSDSDQ